MPEGGFLPSSPLLLPASEGERWMPDELLEGTLPFSEAFASSVLPVKVHKSKNITNHHIICTRSLPFGAIESIYWCPQPESQQSLLMLQPTKLSEAQLAVFSKHLRFSHVHLKSTLLLQLLLQHHVSPLKLFLLFL